MDDQFALGHSSHGMDLAEASHTIEPPSGFRRTSGSLADRRWLSSIEALRWSRAAPGSCRLPGLMNRAALAGRHPEDHCLVGFPETSALVPRGDAADLFLSPLVVILVSQGGGSSHELLQEVAGLGHWITLPRPLLASLCAQAGCGAVRGSAEPFLLAAHLPRALFVEQRRLFWRMVDEPVPVRSARRQVYSLLSRVLRQSSLVPGHECEFTSRRLMAPIANALDRASGRPSFVDGVGRSEGLSRRSVFRTFQRRVGVSAHQLGMELRARRAFDLVGGERAPLAEVVGLLGYASQSHFSSNFQASFGIAPSRLRRAECQVRAPIRTAAV